MIVLSNGYKLPEIGDFGSVWFPALEDNIQRTNDHTHDGTNSNVLSTSSILAITQAVASGAFSADGDRFSAPVSLFGGAVSIDTKTIIVRDPTTKNPIYADIERTGPTSVKVFLEVVRDIEVVIV